MYDIRNSLHSIMLQKKGICRSQSYENFRGEKGVAAQTSSVLGKSRKGTPFRLDLKAEEVFELADIEGRGVIRQFFITVTDQKENGPGVLEKLILRMYWEGEDTPSVECSLGEFFGCGHGKMMMFYESPMIIVPARSFHCYFPMPFNQHARITLENRYGATVSVVAYQVTYTLEESEEGISLPLYTHFHAKQTRCKWKAGESCDLTFISTADDADRQWKETSTYAGIYLSVRQDEWNCSNHFLLRIASGGNDGDVWYEPVAGEELVNGGFRSFRMQNPIQFDQGLEISLISMQGMMEEELEFSSVVYWYK